MAYTAGILVYMKEEEKRRKKSVRYLTIEHGHYYTWEEGLWDTAR